MGTAITNLRPVSRAIDMSAIQDALWLSRCKPFIERHTGECQLGGKFDCVAIIVALVLRAQVRNYQGLLTYFLFADLKWAFDVADVNLMLSTCYEAGIVGLDWRMLDGFFRQELPQLWWEAAFRHCLNYRLGSPSDAGLACMPLWHL